MALQLTGAIKLSEIAVEFSDTAPHSLSEFYAAASSIPGAGTIKLSDFYGASAFTATAQPDSFTTVQDSALSIGTADLISNDDNPDNYSNLEVSNVSSPIGGTVSLNGTTITFTPSVKFGEPASFTYTLTRAEGGESQSTATVKIDPLPEAGFLLYNDTDEANSEIAGFSPPTQETIFNTWARFDGTAYFEDGSQANTTDSTSWLGPPDSPYIEQPNNTGNPTGFVSPASERYDNFTLEVTLRSGQTDDDAIGAIVAFSRANNQNNAIVVQRTQGGVEPRQGFGISVMINGTNSNEAPSRILAEASVDGVNRNGQSGDQQGFNGRGSRVKITRNGDYIRAVCTPWFYQGEAVPAYDENNALEINLTDAADLTEFRGPQSYGYYTWSQGGASFQDEVIVGANDLTKILNGENGEVYEWNENTQTWDLQPDSIQDLTGWPRIVFNPRSVPVQRFNIQENSITSLGRETSQGNLDTTKVLNGEQNIKYSFPDGSTSGPNSGVRVIGLFEQGRPYNNLLSGKPALNTSNNSTVSGNKVTSNVGNGSYFADNGLDINTLLLENGTVVFEDGTVGLISSVTVSSITYESSSEWTLYDTNVTAGFSGLYYDEGLDAPTENWNDNTTFSMAQFGGLGPATAHGWSTGPATFTLTLNDLPAHSKLRYEVKWHMVDSLDNETSYLELTDSNNDFVRFFTWTKQYSSAPSFSFVKSGATESWSGHQEYTYRPWGNGNNGGDGYSTLDSGYFDHNSNTFQAKHFLGANQAQSDEAMYLTSVRVWLDS